MTKEPEKTTAEILEELGLREVGTATSGSDGGEDSSLDLEPLSTEISEGSD